MTESDYTPKQNYLDVIRWNHPRKVYQSGAVAMVSYFGASPVDARPSPETAEWQDFWGATWTDCDGEVFPTGPAIDSLDELNALTVPDFPAMAGFERTRRKATDVDRGEQLLAVMHPYFLYEKSLNLLGAEELMMGMALNPTAMHQFLDKVLGAELAVAEAYAELKPDCVTTMDDYGMQDRLAVSPEMWREFFKPRLKQLIDLYKARVGEHIVFEHHCCGHVMPILEDLIEIGVTILNPHPVRCERPRRNAQANEQASRPRRRHLRTERAPQRHSRRRAPGSLRQTRPAVGRRRLRSLRRKERRRSQAEHGRHAPSHRRLGTPEPQRS